VDANVEGSAVAVLRNWEQIKALEKKPQAEHQSRLDGISRALPALAEAGKIGAKAAKAGFDWLAWRDLLPKVQEEVAELEAEAEHGDKASMEAELGDLLFTVVNLARHLGVDAEMALRGCNARFRGRFKEMEKAAAKPLEELTPSELEDLWAAAKKQLQGTEKQGSATGDQGPEERGPRDQGTEGPRGRKATADPSAAVAAAASAQDDKLLSRAQDDEEVRVLRSAQDDTSISDKGDDARGKA
jgi:XTP/dITP diphosphohydrolase/ATP diphosphatase